MFTLTDCAFRRQFRKLALLFTLLGVMLACTVVAGWHSFTMRRDVAVLLALEALLELAHAVIELAGKDAPVEKHSVADHFIGVLWLGEFYN